MATATNILTAGDNADDSNEFDVDSTPVTISAVVASGALLDNNSVGQLYLNSRGTDVPVTYEDEDGRQRTVEFRRGSMVVGAVAPGTYFVKRPDLTGRAGAPTIEFNISESA